MSSNIRRRLDRLEAADRDVVGCAACGYGSGLYEYEVEWIDLDTPPEPEPPPCGTCGRASVTVIEWDPPPEPLDREDLIPNYLPQDRPEGGR